MTDQQILEKAIQKAVAGGWSKEQLVDYGAGMFMGKRSVYDLIFNHDFAKALWGEEKIECIKWSTGSIFMPAYKYHLQQMVIADDPIKYLGENI